MRTHSNYRLLFKENLIKTPTAICKLMGFLTIALSFLIHGFLSQLLSNNIWTHRRYMAKQCNRYSKILLRLFQIHVQLKGELQTSYFVVSNHLSYLDILILSSIYKTTYVTSMEIKNTPVLGWITNSAGCLYVERRNRNNIENEKIDIIQALKHKISVTVFPEGTSTNGSSVLPFKKSLFECPLRTHMNIQPICINYTKADTETVSSKNRDHLFWYGTMSFLPHLWKVLMLSEIQVEVWALNTICSKDNSIQDLAQISHKMISEQYQAIL